MYNKTEAKVSLDEHGFHYCLYLCFCQQNSKSERRVKKETLNFIMPNSVLSYKKNAFSCNLKNSLK